MCVCVCGKARCVDWICVRIVRGVFEFVCTVWIDCTVRRCVCGGECLCLVCGYRSACLCWVHMGCVWLCAESFGVGCVKGSFVCIVRVCVCVGGSRVHGAPSIYGMWVWVCDDIVCK